MEPLDSQAPCHFLPNDLHYPIATFTVLDAPETYKSCKSVESPGVPRGVKVFPVWLCLDCWRQNALRAAKDKRVIFIHVIEFRPAT